MPNKRLPRWQTCAWLIAWSMIIVWWVAPLVHRPLLTDEAGFIEDAFWWQYAVPPPPLVQSPLYFDLMEVSGVITGWEPEQFRWIGVICVLLQLILVWWLAERLCPRAGPLATLLWATHPMALQGALIVDIDNTVLAVCLSAWCLLVAYAPWPHLRARDTAALGLFMALGLWAKLTTPWVLPLTFIGDGLVHGRWRTAWRAALGMSAWALLSVGLVWAMYRAWYPLPDVGFFQHNTGALLRGFQGTWFPWGIEMAQRAVRLLLWMNPVLVVLGMVVWWKTRQTRQHASTASSTGVLWWFVLLIGVGYWIVRGTHYGFAKYHYPILPIMTALIAAGGVRLGYPTTRRHWGGLLLAAGATACAYHWSVGDLFTLINVQLREAALLQSGEVPQLLQSLGWRVTAGGLLALVIWAVVRWRARGAISPVFVSGLILMLGVHLATNVWQRTTRTSTTYAYGRNFADMRAVIDIMQDAKARHPHQFWIAPLDFAVAAHVRRHPHASKAWDDAELLARALASPRTQGLVVGVSSNSAHTLRRVLPDARIQQLLASQFQSFQAGTYTMWLRRQRGSAR